MATWETVSVPDRDGIVSVHRTLPGTHLTIFYVDQDIEEAEQRVAQYEKDLRLKLDRLTVDGYGFVRQAEIDRLKSDYGFLTYRYKRRLRLLRHERDRMVREIERREAEQRDRELATQKRTETQNTVAVVLGGALMLVALAIALGIVANAF